MSDPTGSPTYSRARIGLHWATAALVALLVGIGLTMTRLDPGSAERLWLSRAHLVLGIVTGVTLVVRAIARARSAPVASLPISTLQQRLVSTVHNLLYVVLFAIVLTGLATSILSGWPRYLSGAVASPPDFAGLPLREGHEVLVFVLLALVGVHVAGVVIHEVRRGGALRRMLPGPRASRESGQLLEERP